MRTHRPSLLLVLLALLALALPAAAQAAPQACASAGFKPGEVAKRKLVRATLCALNLERRGRGMRRLRLSKRLSRAARRHARDMARRNYFSHNSLSGASFVARIKRAGYLHGARSWRAGENIAWGTGTRATPRSTVQAWMNSPGHRANILNRRFRHIGIGVAYGTPARGLNVGAAATYVNDFGTKR